MDTLLKIELVILLLLIIISVVQTLVNKESRTNLIKDVKAAIETLKEGVLKPLKLNSKRKEFWILQGYTLTRFLHFLNKSILLVFLFPIIIFTVDSSKSTYVFFATMVTIGLVIDFYRLCKRAIKSNWRGAVKSGVSLITLLCVKISYEKIYDLFKSAERLQLSAIPKIYNASTIILFGIVAYVIAVLYFRNRVIEEVEKDFVIDTEQPIRIDFMDKPKYEFNRFKNLIVVDSININYEKLDAPFPSEVVTVKASLRYGLFRLTFVKNKPRVIQGKGYAGGLNSIKR
ncbi:hypothetical protein [Enterococcus hulanensis]|uniref:hypothetical protein n=1 Tax=Enterococcus hulanensis TaxID=2559929 RepID=UPI0010F8B823|nr:hypothetical protein [Enterococcus hulanensis]